MRIYSNGDYKDVEDQVKSEDVPTDIISDLEYVVCDLLESVGNNGNNGNSSKQVMMFYNQIINGNKTIENVPKKLREQVQALLDANNN